MMPELTGRDLNIAIALEVCGWQISNDTRLLGDDWYAKGGEHTCELPGYVTDLNACREAEVEIERRGLADQYAEEVRIACWNKSERDKHVGRLIVYADAETRCRAMLAVVRAEWETRTAVRKRRAG